MDFHRISAGFPLDFHWIHWMWWLSVVDGKLQQNCNDYTTVFICIDLNKQSEKTRKLKSEKVKKYQASPKGKANNLAALKNYQQTDKGKAKHIESVRKYQETDNGKAKHIESVKRYQKTEIGKAKHIESVKKY